jgi:YidC/Oxa1 family membrane protein insertase
MERRVLIAVVLSFVVLYAYQAIYPSTPPAKEAQKAAPSSQTSQAAAATKTSAPAGSNPPAVSAPQGSRTPLPPTAPAPAPTEASTPARELAVDTPYVHGVFTSRGGAMKSWQLKKYPDADGHPLEVVAGHAPSNDPLPFTIAVDDPAISARLASAPFTVADESQPGTSGVWRATFEYADVSGLRVRKTFVNDPSKPYVIDFTVSVTRNGQAVPASIEWGPALGSGVVPKSRTYNPAPQPIFFRAGKVTRVAQSKISQQATQEGAFGFVGVDDHYFLTALVQPPESLKVQYAPVDVTNIPDAPEGAHYVSWSVRFTSPVARPLAYFVGPKDFDILAAIDRDLVRSIDFGVFAWLVVPLLRALKWINAYVGNFGWSVIILTILINIVMFPIRHKSVVSMRRMQEVQPEAKAIQDRYKHLKMSDPSRTKMNEELMALYKTRGVNPASGCVPMLLTLPVLYAFYAMLEVAIELRGAPWIWWVHDLSMKDPYYILPILMGVTMFVQQKMTPTTPDPTQQKMMMFMPVMLTAMFLWFASGLVLYYTVNNLWGILQQAITYKLIGPPQLKTIRPPAERRVKRVGGAGPTGQ